MAFRIYRNDKNLYIGHKLQGKTNWTDILIDSDSVEDLKPVLRAVSGDGGYTRQNGDFTAEVDFF